MQFDRLSLAALFSTALCTAGIQAASAQTFPTHSPSIVVAFSAGGPTDTIARIVAGHVDMSFDPAASSIPPSWRASPPTTRPRSTSGGR